MMYSSRMWTLEFLNILEKRTQNVTHSWNITRRTSDAFKLISEKQAWFTPGTKVADSFPVVFIQSLPRVLWKQLGKNQLQLYFNPGDIENFWIPDVRYWVPLCIECSQFLRRASVSNTTRHWSTSFPRSPLFSGCEEKRPWEQGWLRVHCVSHFMPWWSFPPNKMLFAWKTARLW